MLFIYLFILIICLFVLLFQLSLFLRYVVNLSYFLVKCFLVSILNLVAFFLYQYVQTFHVASPHCLPRIPLNIGSVYLTRFTKTWLQKSLSYTFTESRDRACFFWLLSLNIYFLPLISILNTLGQIVCHEFPTGYKPKKKTKAFYIFP